MIPTMARWSLAAALLAPSLAGADEAPETVVRGTVVDEKGTPAGGVMVDVLGWASQGQGRVVWTAPVPSGADGGFVVRVEGTGLVTAGGARVGGTILGTAARASADGGKRLGLGQVVARTREPEAIRIVLRPSLPLAVRVADADGKPVPGAAVEVATGSPFARVVEPASTDAQGLARFLVPAEAPYFGVLAMKDGVGVDGVPNTKATQVVSPGPPPPEVALTLRGSRTITLRARDSSGRPVAGVVFQMDSMISFPGRAQPDRLFGAGRITAVTTGGDGLARWRRVPEGFDTIVTIYPPSAALGTDSPGGGMRLYGHVEGDVTLTAMIRRKAELSGRVVNADGSPAAGVTVLAKGMAEGGGLGERGDSNQPTIAETAADGSYAMSVRPGPAYLMAVMSPGHASTPIQQAPIGEGESRGGLNFVLIEGTRLHGQVANARYVNIALLGEELPAESREPGGPTRLHLGRIERLDADGHYEARLGPGDYEVSAAGHRRGPTIRVDGGGEFPLNFLDDPAAGMVALTGTLVEALPGGGERPVKGQVLLPSGAGSFRAQADETGRFTVRRYDEDHGLYATSTDATKVGTVRVAKGVRDVKVVLGPSATASGRVVDARGKPFNSSGPRMDMLSGPDGLPSHPATFGLRLGPGGRYDIPGLFPGASYRLVLGFFHDSGAWDVVAIKTFRVEGPGPIDLGEFVVPDAKP